MKIAIGSLKFSPVFKSHCLALGNQCEKKGFEVIYLFSQHYRWMLPEDVIKKTIFFDTSLIFSSLIWDYFKIENSNNIKNLAKFSDLSHIYMFNYHPLNHKLANFSKKQNIEFIQHIHETSVDPTNYKFGYGYLVRFLYTTLIDRLFKKTDVVIVSSKKIFDSFNQMNPKFSGVLKCIPLIYQDSSEEIKLIKKNERKYITFVGPPIPTRNVDLFYNMIKYSIEYNLDFKFLLISRKKPKVDTNLLKKLDIYYKDKITDEEMRDLLQKSIATITPYTNISQSSNVFTSYRYGTPVIASNIPGLKQFVFPKRTGCLVDLDAPIENWINSLIYISNNFDILSENCRKYYEKNFSETNWNKYLKDNEAYGSLINDYYGE